MTVYVDKLLVCLPSGKWKHTHSCHMIADDLEELIAFAVKIGLQPSWLQSMPRHPHYDLTASKRGLAVENGAIELDRKDFWEKVKDIANA